jgi:hypothetical protein
MRDRYVLAFLCNIHPLFPLKSAASGAMRYPRGRTYSSACRKRVSSLAVTRRSSPPENLRAENHNVSCSRARALKRLLSFISSGGMVSPPPLGHVQHLLRIVRDILRFWGRAKARSTACAPCTNLAMQGASKARRLTYRSLREWSGTW